MKAPVERVERVELRRVALSLVTPFVTALGDETERDVLLVRVDGGGTHGWGECAALRTPSYSAEFVDGAHTVIRDHLAPRLFSAGAVTAITARTAWADVTGHSMAKAALELAILDAELRRTGQSLADCLGATRDRVESGVSIGLFDLDELLTQVGAYVDAGYRRVKLKIEPGRDVAMVRAVRAEFPALALQVDANGAYSTDDVDVLAALDEFDLLLVEQPLPADDLLGHADLARQVRTPICLDESITSLRVAEQAIALGACSVVCVKAGRVGGYLDAVAVHDLCVAQGVAAWCGGMLETGIGRAANVALAALPGFTLPGDLSASERYYERDIVTAPFVLDDGFVRVPTQPGLGVEIDIDFLDSITTAVEILEPA